MKQSLKNKSCQNCKFKTGSRCNKNDEYISDDDWCSAWKLKPIQFLNKKDIRQYVKQHAKME